MYSQCISIIVDGSKLVLVSGSVVLFMTMTGIVFQKMICIVSVVTGAVTAMENTQIGNEEQNMKPLKSSLNVNDNQST